MIGVADGETISLILKNLFHGTALKMVFIEVLRRIITRSVEA